VRTAGQSPVMDVMERARRWKAREEGAYVNVFYGFPWSDVPDVGTTVHVMTDYGNGNTIILVPAYHQTIPPEENRFGPIEPDDYQVFVSKTRVHFRRGFDETGSIRSAIRATGAGAPSIRASPLRMPPATDAPRKPGRTLWYAVISTGGPPAVGPEWRHERSEGRRSCPRDADEINLSELSTLSSKFFGYRSELKIPENQHVISSTAI